MLFLGGVVMILLYFLMLIDICLSLIVKFIIEGNYDILILLIVFYLYRNCIFFNGLGFYYMEGSVLGIVGVSG